MAEADPILDARAVADRLGVEVRTVWEWRTRGVAPEPDGMVGRSPWWHASTIDEWWLARSGPGIRRRP